MKEIQKKREWKTQGAGASFMGVALAQDESEILTSVEAVALVDSERIIYASSLETSCAIYAKNPQHPESNEEYITKRINTRLHHMDYEPNQKLIVASVSDGYRERHLALCNDVKPNFRIITEGDSVDIMPSFSRYDHGVVYFSSAGFYVDTARGGTHYSSYAICKFDLGSNEVDEVLSDKEYDFLYPRQTADGTLYCIRRLKEQPRGPAPIDVALAPVRFLRAVFGWMNFFSQRYSGESLIKGTGGGKSRKKQGKERAGDVH